jgi:hypothetical protein
MRECTRYIYRPRYMPLLSGKRLYINGIAIFRLRVKLKPEGAPRRYASEHDRRNWETYPEEMRKCPF